MTDFYASFAHPSMKPSSSPTEQMRARGSDAQFLVTFRTQVYKFLAMFLQPFPSLMRLVSAHSLILLVRTETEG